MWRVIRRVLRLSGDLSQRIKGSFICSFLDAIFEMLPLVAMFWFLLQVQQRANLDNVLLQCVLLLIAGIAGRIIFKYLLYRLQSTAGFEFVSRERLFLGDHLRKLPMGFFHENRLGEITATATTELNFLEQYSMHVLDRISTGTISTVVMGIAVFILDWRLGIVFLAGVSVSMLIYQVMQKKAVELSQKQRSAQAYAVSATLEYIQGISIIKAFSMNKKSITGIEAAYEKANQSIYAMEKAFAPLNALYSICFRVASAVILFVGSWLALEGELDFVRFVVIIIASFTVFNPIEVMGQMTQLVRMMDVSLDRVEAIKQVQPIDADGKDIPLNKHNIRFENVSFMYKKEEPLLQNISFRIPEKTMTAIVGPSGSGKTTLTRLMARFWDVTGGKAFVGEVNVKAMSCDSLLKNISIVFQNVYLFHDTIRNNILLARPDATEEEMIDAAKKAQCHDFIAALPDGYDTMVGEGGGTLSGGEKQRISIARAILKDAPIVLLDEATASVDPENELSIQNALHSLVKNKTLVVIAHRLTTVQDAEQILVMGNGTIADRGTHAELINRDGQYKIFWEIRERASRWRLGHSYQEPCIVSKGGTES